MAFRSIHNGALGAYIRNDANPIFNHVTIGYNSSGFGGGAIYLRDGSNLVIKIQLFGEILKRKFILETVAVMFH